MGFIWSVFLLNLSVKFLVKFDGNEVCYFVFIDEISCCDVFFIWLFNYI